MKRCLFLSACGSVAMLVATLGGCASLEGETAAVNAQRPSFSSDTGTTHEGTFEFEAGGAIDPSDSIDVPATLKWGTGPASEMFLGWSPFRELSQPGEDARGVGDLQVGFRHRFLEDEELSQSAALQIITKLPTGDQSEGLSTGEIDFFAAGILTKSFDDVAVTAFYQAGILGEPNDGDTSLEHLIAAATGLPVSERWGVSGEAAAILNAEQDQESYVATVAGSYAVSRSFVFDIGVAVGLGGDESDFQVLFGFTSNLGASPLSVLAGQ